MIIGLAGIIFAIYFTVTHPGQGFAGYFDLPSAVLLGIMPPSVMLLSHTLQDFGVGFSLLFQAAFNFHNKRQREIIDTLTRCSAMVRSEGIGSLVAIRDRIGYPLLREGMSLIINDFTSDEIRHNLTNKINAKQSRMALASNLFTNMSKASPGVGMLGTLLGLTGMMSNMKDPSNIGSGMALAMMTTLYGLLLGTVIYGPWGEKIALEAEKSLEIDLMVLEGLISLKGKKSSIHMKDIMNTYGTGKHREQPQQLAAHRR
jgi:chemotaxis protein MotA